MTNLASVLKSEVTRLARKELRTETASLKKAVAAYRLEIAALKRRAQELERQLKQLSRSVKKPSPEMPTEVPDGFRFSAKGLAAHRRRLGLSAEDCGLLLEASSQSVYNWEAGSTRPQEKHLAAIAALRGLGKREAMSRLEVLQAPK